jgi:anti-sigma factor RsiW
MSEHLGELLSAHLDGELNGEELRTLDEHLPSCDLCQTELAVLHRGRSAFRSLPLLEAPSVVVADVKAPVIKMHRVRRVAAVAAVAFVAFVGLATFQTSRPVEVSLSDVTQTQLELHQDVPTLIPQMPVDSQ